MFMLRKRSRKPSAAIFIIERSGVINPRHEIWSLRPGNVKHPRAKKPSSVISFERRAAERLCPAQKTASRAEAVFLRAFDLARRL
jgi:hypothetical protein